MDELPQIGWREFILWLMWRRRRLRVVERSMYPLLKPDDEVLVNPHAYRQTPPQLGDIVVAHHPFKPNLLLIKRVAASPAPKMYVLIGDNRMESTDSRTYGPVGADKIVGRVTCRFA